MFATPRTRIDVKKERVNHAGIREKLFAKYKSPSPAKESKKKRKKEKKKKTERSHVYGDRTSANVNAYFTHDLEGSHRGYHSEEKKKLYDLQHGLENRKVRSAPRARRPRIQRRKASLLGLKGDRKLGEKYNEEIISRKHRIHETKAADISHPRYRTHHSKAELLRFTGDEKLHQEYEKQRIEHRGGTHDIVDYDGHGHFNSFGDARNYTIEEQVAVGAADDRSNFERFDQIENRFDAELLDSMVDKNLRQDKSEKTKTSEVKHELTIESRKIMGELRQRLRGFAYALRESFQAQDSLRRNFVTQDQFISALRNMAITLTRRKRDALFHRFDPNNSNRILYEPIVNILCGSSKRKTTTSRKATSPPRNRIHQSKAALLGFTGDEKLHREYEKQRIEHRGGTHNIVDYDGHGHFNTWGDARNYTTEEQVALGAADDRSYYERHTSNSAGFDDTVEPTDGHLKGRLDLSMLNGMMGTNIQLSSSSSSSSLSSQKKKKTSGKRIVNRSSSSSAAAASRPRIHRKKAALLGFMGDEKLHQEYEKQRIEHRGGTHNIVDYDGHGHFNTWADPRNYTIEERLATGTADDRSYYQKNRRATAVKVPLKETRLSDGRIDMELLGKIMSK